MQDGWRDRVYSATSRCFTSKEFCLIFPNLKWKTLCSDHFMNLPPNQKNNLHLFHRALSQCDAAHLSLIQPEDSEEECWETAHEQHAGISRIQSNEHQMSLTENQSSVQQRSSVWAQRMRTLVLFPVTLILCLWIKPAAYLIVSSPLPLRISHKITDTR